MSSCDIKDLDRLVSLTCQKSFDSLQKAFCQVLREMMKSHDYRLYVSKSFNADSEDELQFMLLGASTNEVSEKTRHQDQIKLQHLVGFDSLDTIANATGDSIVLPMLNGHRIFGALVIEQHKDFYADFNANIILSAITIFSNQMALLQHSSQDALTGLYNRYMLDNAMEHILSSSQARRTGDKEEANWCLAMMDIDHFKSVNDTYGHLIGDEVLLQLAQLMKKSFRHDDLLFRFGGEEFSILLKDVSLDQAGSTLERFRQSVCDYRFPQVGRVTVSLGLTYMTPGKFPSTLLGNADKALYYSKENGRNQLSCFEYLHELQLLDDIGSDSNDLEFL